MNRTLPGYVHVRVKGEGRQLLIAELSLKKVEIRMLQETGPEEITFLIRLQAISSLRRAAFKKGCAVSLSQGGGVYYYLLKMQSRISIILALCIACLMFYGSLQFLWGINVEGGSPEVRTEAEELLRLNGYQSGALMRQLSSEKEVISSLYQSIEQISWAGFEWNGTRLTVHIREKKELPPTAKDEAAHLVASKTGTVQRMLIDAGTPVKERYQVVKKGELLVSGFIGAEGKEKAIHASGEVYANTWYETNVTIPVDTMIYTLTGKQYSSYALQTGDVKTPDIHINRASFSIHQKDRVVKTFDVFGWKVPIEVIHTNHKEVKKAKKKLTMEQIKEAGIKIGAKQVLAQTGGTGTITKEKILHEQIENGKVKLTIYYQALEEIAEVKPFTEETRE
ncbi:sporulation protein YqfD [Jeotgalibacillus sp. R-1-5s-1]|uniref:sporulation protein YqfD n=1 Tax=Jeotgalibacillus sp. R-1-5s-1 TaxID=2555897 RepID=UPI00106C7760|nr:sporulation protein YqfD [Jeotgalibacillus sp. R-1-5s-1]TFD92329.1 sporulation protein YqfD [Jeotgalibacillus sp. R-1-5s-1]